MSVNRGGLGGALRLGIPFVIVAIATLALGSGCCAEMMGYGSARGEPQTPIVSDASNFTVEISGFDFSPRDLTVKPGTAITWVNRDFFPHDATDESGDWSTGTLSWDERETLTLSFPGVYQYYCTIHPDMRATLTVK